MIGTIRKHSKWLWFVIIISIVVTFVYWGSQPGHSGGRTGRANYGSIDGQRITPDEMAAAQRETYLRYFLSYGSWPESDTPKSKFDPQHEAYQWLFFIKKLQEYNIEVDNHSVAQMVTELLREFGRASSPDHNGGPIPFDTFVKRLLLPHGISAEDLENYIRHDVGIQQMISVVGVSGKLVTAQEGRFLFERDHLEYSTAGIFFAASNYLASVSNASPSALRQFYTNEMASYRIPQRVQVSYAEFDASNCLGQAEKELTNLNASVEESFRKLDTNYLRIGKTPAEAKAWLRQEFLRRKSMDIAGNQANEFLGKLLDMEPERLSNLATLASSNGLAVKITAPFDAESGPTEFDGGPGFAKAAFSLGPDKLFADQPIAGQNAIYVIGFEKRLPDEIPPFAQIQAQVAADYMHRQAVELARRTGEEFVRAATNALAQGKTFSAVCAERKVTPVSLPHFSLSTRELPELEEHVDFNEFRRVAANTPTHQVSALARTPDGGFAVYVSDRVPVDPSRIEAELPGFMNLLRRARVQEAVNLWLNKEASVSLRDTPMAPRGQPGRGAGAAATEE
jgi:hypothetical protein